MPSDTRPAPLTGARYSRRGLDRLARGLPADPESYNLDAAPCADCLGLPVRYDRRGCAYEAVRCAADDRYREACRMCGQDGGAS